MSIWESFKNFFQQEQESSPNNPLVHEVIERSESELQAFAKWKTTLVCRRLMDWLNQQYVNYLVNPDDTDEAIAFLNKPHSKGFVIYLRETGYTKEDAMFLMDLLKEKIQQYDYKNYVSDTRSYTTGDVVENVQRHYLKPRNKFSTTEKFKQIFGNVTIELLSRNDKVFYLKCIANSYQDHKFEDASDFNELMQGLFSG